MENQPKTKKTRPSPPPELEVGSHWVKLANGAKVRVLAYAEGYVMARNIGCAPWVKHWREFTLDYAIVTPSVKKKASVKE